MKEGSPQTNDMMDQQTNRAVHKNSRGADEDGQYRDKRGVPPICRRHGAGMNRAHYATIRRTV